MNISTYKKARENYSRTGFKSGRTSIKNQMLFFEEYGDNICFRIVMKNTGNGSESEYIEIDVITKDDFDRI